MNSKQLKKLNEIKFHWITPCEKCGNEDFTIVNLRRLPSYIFADCKCKKCGHIMKMELNGTDLDNEIDEILKS